MNAPSREGEVIAQGRYKLNRSLGRGTFGDVYLAESTDPSHTAGQTQVVVKVLHAQWAQVAEVVERFRRESLVTRKIEHPHVARIFEHAQLADGVPYIVMEYLPGRSLRAQMDLGGLPYQECLGVLAAIADAQAILLASGVTKDEVQLVVNDLKAIAAEAQKNLPSGGGKLKGKRFAR